ncbi:bifunctional glycosyltransferase/CDP-glycerol:glycerophosphate glycerophosphotransferase [Microlunatus speluncae]|uniref:bifunctional glycosyltransferase/CDP-glycerol:glycerophosphate glycerophosphotransferase n=1 Tax=Microlunatus speluncae TaxID=2594267 RepID=UPI0012667056|nr:CDP-glycerol glycerophosphotransferase family protein [Microlunatus speluncae]
MPPTVPDVVKTYWQKKSPPMLRNAVRTVRQVVLDRPSGLVTVIVPFYRVEAYFEACLRSIANQTHRDLQVLLIDDGSPDDSIKIARAYARRDRRFRIIRQRNQGLGAARNTGLRHAKGAFLTFVDSDDVLPADAVATLVAALRHSGSDFAIGTPRRMAGKRRWVPDWAGTVHAKDRFGLRVGDFPEILKDVFVCNKLFATDFFHRVVQQFPVGIRYEDQEPTARAYVAGTFDVLSAVTYDWRVREDGSSITQQKADPDDLADRLAVKGRVRQILRAQTDPATYSAWLAKAIGFDLRSYFEQVPRTDLDYWTKLQRAAAALAQDLEVSDWTEIPIVDRLPTLAAVADRRDIVARLVTTRSEYGWRVPTVAEPDGVFLDPSYDEELAVIAPDRSLLRLTESDLGFVTRVDRVDWEDRVLRIAGHAYIAGLSGDQLTDLRLRLVPDGSTGSEVETAALTVPLERCTDPLVDQESGDAWNSYAATGFVARIDTDLLDEFQRRSPQLRGWTLRAEVEAQGVVREGPLNRRDLRGSASRLPINALTEQGRWVVEFTSAEGLQLKLEEPPAVTLESLEVTDLTVRVTVAGAPITGLELAAPTLHQVLTVPGLPDGDRTTFEVTLPEIIDRKLRADEHVWNLRLIPGVDRRLRMIWPGSTNELDRLSPTQARLRAICSRIGTLRLLQNHWWAAVDGVELDEDYLVVQGTVSTPVLDQYQLRIAGSAAQTSTVLAEVDPETGRFTGRVPLLSDYGRRLSAGGFSLRMMPTEADGSQVERWVRVDDGLQDRFPLDLQSATSAVRLSRTPKAAALWVKPRKPYRPDERGRLAQRQLHQIFLDDRPVEPRDAVLFECFNGRSVGDSVLALHQELLRRDLGLELFWTVDDHGVQAPPGGTPLLIHSREWMEVLAGARYLVNNNNFPFYFRKGQHQTYLQTWHGTPLKKIGNDVPAPNLSLSYRALMIREAGSWDQLIAQNDFAAEALPRAFGYSGPVINTGYPRNDALLGAEAEERRHAIRRLFAIPDAETAVLYAPTWRDNVTKNNRYALVSYLDFARLQTNLPGQTFLIRGHANTSESVINLPKSVINATHYSDLNDLMLAADVLITDYSSVMFDFAVTGKPIILLTPDLETYRDSTRGFYLDFEATAPGPICRDQARVEQELRELPHFFDRYGDRYRAFVERFAPRDDGHAAARVADLVWADPAPNRNPSRTPAVARD